MSDYSAPRAAVRLFMRAERMGVRWPSDAGDPWYAAKTLGRWYTERKRRKEAAAGRFPTSGEGWSFNRAP